VITLSSDPRPQPLAPIGADSPRRTYASIRGRLLGTFKNTYYDFPNEGDFEGEAVALMNSQCQRIKAVPRGFFESVCVQGSGMLSSGTPVSFSRRDCSCAELCPRTEQKICFDALDASAFPWGRGATGQSITPLLTVAADPDVLPMGTGIYIPEYDGLPRDPSHSGKHDGCFLVQDQGLKVKGRHVDVFTGDPAVTRLWNQLVPSNRGVTVVLKHPRCARARSGGLVIRAADQ
jgi:3D (Asp-Asp-Asp) domain-containing protein